MFSFLKRLTCIISILSLFAFWALENYQQVTVETDSKAEIHAVEEDCVESFNLVDSIVSLPIELYICATNIFFQSNIKLEISYFKIFQKNPHELILQKHLTSIPPPNLV